MDSKKRDPVRNPREGANPFSKIFFWWLKEAFTKGSREGFEEEDLYSPLSSDLSEDLGDKLESNWEDEIERSKELGKQPSLEKAVIATFGWQLFLTSLYYFFNVCVARIGQPLFLKELISYFQFDEKFLKPRAYIFACSLLATSFLIAFCYTHGHLQGRQLGMRLRIACSSLLYYKILKLPSNMGARGDTGQVINLLSNDVNKFDKLGQEICYLAATPIQVIATTYCLWTVGGIPGIIGLFFLLILSIPFQVIIGKVITKFRWKTAEATDRRVRITSEVISLIKGVKMYTWEEYFQSMINLIRIEEINNIKKAGYLFSLAVSFGVITERLILFGTLLSFIFLDLPISPEKVFALASMFNSLQYTLSIHFPFAVEATAEARVSFQRIQKYLLQNDMEQFHYLRRSSSLNENKSPIEAVHATAAWLVNITKPVLHGINLEIKMGSLCAIVGHVGSGKSSLIQAILSELPLKEGKLIVRGKVSYMPQQAWLFDGSVRQNILFGNPYQEKRYNEVIKVCALTTDLQQLPHNDFTIVGDKGVSLSGGQRARVSLARCIYHNADIYLLDDPLSSIDCRVSKQIFEDCIVSFLHDKTRIVVTHQLQFLHQVDFIIVLNNGKIENQGSYNAVIAEIKDKNQFLNANDDNVTENIETLINNNISEAGIHLQNGKINHSEEKQNDEHTELIQKGKVKYEVYIKYFLAGSKLYSILLLIILFLLGQIASSGSDFWVAYWSNLEEVRQHHDVNVTKVNFLPIITEKSTLDSALSDQLLFNKLDANYDLLTFNKMLQPRQLLLTNKDILLNIQMDIEFPTYNFSKEVVDMNYESKTLLPYNSGTSYPSFLEKSFSNNNESENTSTVTSFESDEKIEVNIFDTGTCILIHTVLIITCIIVTISRGIFFINICISSSLSLHNMVLESLIKGTMRFFDTNPAGRILNRMFKDLGSVDDMLPRDMMMFLQIFSTMLGLASLLMVTNYWLILPTIITALLYVKLTQLYLKTAENIKRLEGKMRSPVFSHVNATISGVNVIRAFQHQNIVKKEFDIHQDIHSSAWFLSIACSAAFGFWMDCISIAFSASVIFTFIIFENDIVGSEVGLCVSQCLVLLSMAQSGIRYMAEAANNMTSVERLLQYTEIEQEAGMNLATGMKSPTNWPSEGRIQFSGVSLRYAESLPLVLKNLDFKIESGQRVGIVGRTGSGKSSIITALLRLAPLKGDITIDGINIQKLCLKDLRRNITVIPQDPILFSASLRDSLDPNNRQPDHEIWAALEEVGLKDSISSLEMLINEGGSNLSVGQRQLVCLARAVLQKNKILILDEATANVDSGTDDLIQETIRQYFGQCTVLSISHRLKNVMDMDHVFVMNDGLLIEHGHPHILLQNESGLFYKMVEQLGQPLGHQLRDFAKKAFESHNVGKEYGRN